MNRTWLAYCDLKPGDRFRFVYNPFTGADRLSPTVLTKRRGVWYEAADGKQYTTGRAASVALVDDKK